MMDNPNAPDPRIGKISKALDEFEEAVVELTLTYNFFPDKKKLSQTNWDRQEKREKLMDLIRRMKHEIYP